MADVLDPGGCCLAFSVGGIGAVSGLLIWHALLLGMLGGGGVALVVLVACAVLALFGLQLREKVKRRALMNFSNRIGE